MASMIENEFFWERNILDISSSPVIWHFFHYPDLIWLIDKTIDIDLMSNRKRFLQIFLQEY